VANRGVATEPSPVAIVGQSSMEVTVKLDPASKSSAIEDMWPKSRGLPLVFLSSSRHLDRYGKTKLMTTTIQPKQIRSVFQGHQ
jgi:hypothetical protein